MLVFPNAKINLGLHVTEKRPDGYHAIETLFYPVNGLCDALEFLPASQMNFTLTGLKLDSTPGSNLVMKAYFLLQKRHNLPPVNIHLHKCIPTGAGLGGGSSDAAFMLKALSAYFQLGLSGDELQQLASTLGSDCAFFIQNRPVMATGRGEIMEPFAIDLSAYHLVLVKPSFGVGTAEAYAGIKPYKPVTTLAGLISWPVEQWKEKVENHFETSVFARHPELATLKQKLYEAGAIYASMSGSGSALYGLFREMPAITNIPAETILYRE